MGDEKLTKGARLLRNLLLLVLLAGAALTLGFAAGRCSRGDREQSPASPGIISVRRDTVTVRDTVRIAAPSPVGTAVVRDTVIPLPAAAGDSAEMALPVVSRHYGDSLYEAWVSGPVDPRLDSLRVYPLTATVTERISVTAPPKRWHIGISAGYALTPRGFQPAVGVTLTYSLWSF